MRTHTWLSIAGVALATLAIHTNAALSASPPFPGAKGQPFQALQSQINDINATIADLQTQIGDINTQIASLQGDVAGNSAAIATLQATANALQNQINFLTLTKQNNVINSCAVNSSIRLVLPSGAVVCEFDDGEVRTTTFGTVFNIGPGLAITGVAICPIGLLATGGGYQTNNFANVTVYLNEPSGATGWVVGVRNNTPFTVSARATVKCALSQ